MGFEVAGVARRIEAFPWPTGIARVAERVRELAAMDAARRGEVRVPHLAHEGAAADAYAEGALLVHPGRDIDGEAGRLRVLR